MICATCPWRHGADSDAIPGFDYDKANCDLRRTDGPGDEFRPIMACHLSRDGTDRVCGGYAASESAMRNLAFRMAVIDGSIDFDAVLREAEGVDLHPDIDTMLDELGVHE